MVQTIFNQCPFIGGEAVIKARILLQLVNDSILYDDVTICVQQGVYRDAIYTKEEQDDIIIRPNPTNGVIKVTTMLNGRLIKLCDIYSNQLLEKRIEKNGQEIELNLEQYSNGVYFLKIIDRDGTMVMKPLILLR